MSRKSARVVVVVVAAVVAGVMVGSVTMTAVATVAVAAEGSSAELVTPLTGEVSGDAQPLPANNNTRPARGTGDVAATPAPAPAVSLPGELVSLATEIGQAWSQTYVRTLHAQERDIVGAWPGTIREARRQVLARIKTKLEPEQLDQLAKMTNLAARRGWESVSEPDLES
jgi:hypothetical protein